MLIDLVLFKALLQFVGWPRRPEGVGVGVKNPFSGGGSRNAELGKALEFRPARNAEYPARCPLGPNALTHGHRRRGGSLGPLRRLRFWLAGPGKAHTESGGGGGARSEEGTWGAEMGRGGTWAGWGWDLTGQKTRGSGGAGPVPGELRRLAQIRDRRVLAATGAGAGKRGSGPAEGGDQAVLRDALLWPQAVAGPVAAPRSFLSQRPRFPQAPRPHVLQAPGWVRPQQPAPDAHDAACGEGLVGSHPCCSLLLPTLPRPRVVRRHAVKPDSFECEVLPKSSQVTSTVFTASPSLFPGL